MTIILLWLFFFMFIFIVSQIAICIQVTGVLHLLARDECFLLCFSDQNDPNWWKGTCKGRTGLVPSNYVAEQAQSIDAPLQEAAKRGENKLGDTSLHAAAWKGHPDIVQSLLEKGVRVDLRNNEKKYAADMATDAQSAALIKRRSGTNRRLTAHNRPYLDEEDSD
uniref:Osteoclast-stimulating factor 1 n=1 Tax=Eptatretus burgeri TaxID=7764 RepID=A0A8C4R6M9_EPTBU